MSHGLLSEVTGLFFFARKIIETAEAEVDGYHKHMDDIGAPGLTIFPEKLDIVIRKNSGASSPDGQEPA